MKQIFTAIFIFTFAAAAFSQFRMVGNGSWTTVNDSTYTANITFQADLTGQGYLANQITDTFRLFTPIEQVYRVDSVWNATFSSASLRVVEWNGDHGIPVGQVMVYNPDGRETLPQNPFGSTGATAQIQAAVDTYNARIRGQSEENVFTSTITYDTLTAGGVTAYITYEGGTGLSLTNPSAGEYLFTVAEGTHVHEASVFGDNTTLNASQEMLIKVDNAANLAARRFSVQLFDALNNALVDQQATATVHTQSVSAALVTITIPGLNGFGASGYIIEIR